MEFGIGQVRFRFLVGAFAVVFVSAEGFILFFCFLATAKRMNAVIGGGHLDWIMVGLMQCCYTIHSDATR